MDEGSPRPPQYSLKLLLLLPVAVGGIVWLYTAGLSSESLFFLLGVPVLMLAWFGLCRLASHFLAEFFD